MGPQRVVRRYVVVALAVLFLGALSAIVHFLRGGPTNDPNLSQHLSRLGTSSSSPHGDSASLSSSYSYNASEYTTSLVLGRLTKEAEGIEWVDKLRGFTNKAIYVVDDVRAPLHLPQNHGRESIVYLKYILENYNNLTDVTFFWHADGKTWHNNLLLREDSALTINRMRRDYIVKKGYVNSRCDTSPGCPRWIKFDPTPGDHRLHSLRLADMFTPDRWASLFPETDDPPQYLSAPCCSQFAVSRDTIRRTPKQVYQRLHDWIDSQFFDMYSGRFMEYTWHYLFLGKEEVCPNILECYCNMYDLCFDDYGLLERWQSHAYRADELSEQLASIETLLKETAKDSDVNNNPDRQAVASRLALNEKKAGEYRQRVFDRFAVPSTDIT